MSSYTTVALLSAAVNVHRVAACGGDQPYTRSVTCETAKSISSWPSTKPGQPIIEDTALHKQTSAWLAEAERLSKVNATPSSTRSSPMTVRRASTSPPEKSRAATMVKRRDPGPGTHVHEHAETGLLMSLFAWPQRLRHQRTWEIESPVAVIAA